MSGRYLKQSTASQTRTIGPFVDDTDFKTAEDGLTIANTDIRLKKNGAADVAKNSGGGTADVNGCYAVTWDATDTDTVGELFYTVKVAGALQVFGSYTVLEEAVYDMLFGASAVGYISNAPVNVAQLSGDSTAADNAEAFFDGTGYAGTNNVIPTVTTLTGHTPQTGDSYAIVNSGTHGNAALKTLIDAVDDFVDTEVANIDTNVSTLLTRLGTPSNLGGGATVAANLSDIEAQTDDIGAAGAGLTAITSLFPSNFSTVTIASNAVLATLSNLAHGGTSATLRLGSSTTTPALYATNSGGNAVRFESTGNDGHGLLALGVGAGDGVHFEGGVDGDGAHLQGGATTGRGIHATGGAGAAYLDGSVSLTSTLTVSGATSLAALSMTTLTASGAVELQSTVTVTGAATFSSTTDGTLGAIIADLEDGGRTDLLIDALVADNPNRPTRGVQLDNLVFTMVDATDFNTPEPSVTVTAQISKDGGAFGACTNSVSEISAGFYKITLTATELTADSIALKFTGTGCAQRNFAFRTQPT